MKLIKAPKQVDSYKRSLFLAGSIEMGLAKDWQSHIIEGLKDTDITVLNPRRNDWDSSWEQSVDNLKFVEQVEWEMTSQQLSDLVLFYFDPQTKAPITLFELGHCIGGDLVVCCPEGYWRKGNVDVICKRYDIPQVDTLDNLVQYTKEFFNAIR